jgi:hypothetical protein
MVVRKKTKKAPKIRFRQSLFWDVDPKKIDPEKHKRYIIERMLEFGNKDEIRWLFSFYTKRLIRNTLERSRGVLHKKTKNLWSLVLKQ